MIMGNQPGDENDEKEMLLMVCALSGLSGAAGSPVLSEASGTGPGPVPEAAVVKTGFSPSRIVLKGPPGEPVKASLTITPVEKYPLRIMTEDKE